MTLLSLKQQQQQLMQPIKPKDIVTAQKELPVDNAPGIDEFNVELFKTHLDLIGDEVIKGIMQFLRP